MRLFFPTVALLGACLLAGCQDKQEAPLPQREPGLRAIPSGRRPGQAPDAGIPDSLRIDMDTREVRVLVVPPGSPASRAGFAAGDVIVAADGKEISNEDQLSSAMTAASTEKVFFEVKRDQKLLTLALASRNPGWVVLSGDSFRGFLLTRAQNHRKVSDLPVGKTIPAMKLPAFSGKDFSLSPRNPRPLALLFWGTFLDPCYDHLRVLARACRSREVFCLAVDTMELFTAVGKTKQFQAELERVHKTLWPDGPIPIDLFLESERKFGVKKLPTLILADRQGKITARFDGPLADPEKEIPRALDGLLSR